MQFYKMTIFFEKKKAVQREKKIVLKEQSRSLAMGSDAFNQKLEEKAFFFLADAGESRCSVGIILREQMSKEDTEAIVVDYLMENKIEVDSVELEEITLETLIRMLRSADWSDYIESDDDIMERYGLDDVRRVRFKEKIIGDYSKEKAYAESEQFLMRHLLGEELDRIYAGKGKSDVVGHPVHYMIQTDDRVTRDGAFKILLHALYENGRINNRRCCFLNVSPNKERFVSYQNLYQVCAGGSIVIGYSGTCEEEDNYASADRDVIENLCKAIKKYRNEVLTILCLPRECTRIKELFYECLHSISFVELKEEYADRSVAESFLKGLAKKHKVRVNKQLLSRLDENGSYLAPELHEIFEQWYNQKLKTCIYPQYKKITSVNRYMAKEKPKGSAHEELMDMIGLEEAKQVIGKALDYFKAQKLFADRGMKQSHPGMHMVFTGNPGTAKTTVARLFARIMRDNNILSKGHLVEVGRGDLVGKYVGWTATLVQKKFREAEGGVLFIDEAYSLVDGRDGLFGDEAINTIVQEMENHREDMVVIFAGYPDKMEAFIQRNPGLRSRIAFHVPFADYDADELCEIAKLIGSRQRIRFTEDAVEKMNQVLQVARMQEDFGNGRYVRSMIEKARMAQAERLLSMDVDQIGRKEIETICAEDIPLPDLQKEKKAAIGFHCA